ncbi:MAG: gliding motility-associated C-terminal domain-containing protein [Bacteroidetes bacterium]|nr:gliding motility-associated C-terminal domain-containing protein [Bacteroidota bacterium]
MKTLSILIILICASTAAVGQSCTGSLGQAIINQTFGAGPNPGPTLPPGVTNLTYTTTNCATDGYYTVTNYTTGCFGGWITTNDHTGDPNGYFMLINASIQSNTFYVDTIRNLCSSVTYQSGAWVINLIVSGSNYIQPNLTFTIKTLSGTVLQSNNTGNIPITGGGNWNHYTFNFTTPPGVTSVVLSISNNAPGGSGNDLAIDDITFKPVGPGINVGIQGYTVDTLSFCGAVPALTLTSHVDSCYASTDYQWQISTDSGHTWVDIAGATSTHYNPSITAIGAYLYRLAAAATGNISSSNCRVLSSVIAIYDRGGAVSVSPRDTTVCPGSRVILRASGSATYIWSDTHQGASDPVLITSDTQYIVSGTAAPGCTATDTARLHVYSPPAASITQVAAGLCSSDSATLTASGGGTYIWSTGSHTLAIKVAPPITMTYTVTVSDIHGCTDTAIASVQPHTFHRWDISATVIPPPCPNLHQGSIATSVPSGHTYHYAWNTGDTLSYIQSLTAGTYRLTVTDSVGCDTILNFQLNYISAPSVAIYPADTTVCPGSNVILSATGLFVSYRWSDGHQGATDTVRASVAASYIITATDASGCTAVDTATIRLYTPPVASISMVAPGVCTTDSATLTASGGISYTWNTGVQTPSIRVTPWVTTSYAVTVSDVHGCTDTASTTVQGHPPHAWLTSATTIDPHCPGIRDGSIQVIGASGFAFHFSWSTGDTVPQVQSLTDGDYIMTITDSMGCDSVLHFHLAYQQIPVVFIVPPDTTICPYQTVVLSTSPGFTLYQWSDLHQTADDTITTAVTGIYIVTATDAQGCIATDTATIHVSPPATVHITEYPTGHCTTDPVVLYARGGITYTWSTGALTDSITTPPSGTYSVTAANSYGCTAADTIVSFPATTPWLVDASYIGPPCPQKNSGQIRVTLRDSNHVSYLWNTGGTSDSLSSLGAGIYTVTVGDGAGCDTILTFPITYTYSLGVSLYPADTTVSAGATVPLNAIATTDYQNSYEWTPNSGLSCTSCASPYVWNSQGSYSYIVQVTDKNGCTASDTMYLHVKPPPSIYIPNAFSPNADGINDFFHIFTSGPNDENVTYLNIKIFDRWGEKIFESYDSDFMWDGSFKGEPMPPGVYVYLVEFLLKGSSKGTINKGSLTLIR